MSDEFVGAGWTNREGKTIFVTKLRHRKQVTLLLQEGNQADILAYFTSPEQAQHLLDWLDTTLGPLKKETT